jgi:methionine biosynthesis protein MetW
MSGGTERAIHDAIVGWVEPGSSVLELGCGRGDLLSRLVVERSVRAQGIEIQEARIGDCLEKGLNVLHEEVDTALHDYEDAAFDYTIFDRSLQRVAGKPDLVLAEALRVSRRVIIGFSNFAHYRARWQISFRGRTPVTRSLPFEWHDTPNLHFLSIADFTDYCDSRNIQIEKVAFFTGSGPTSWWPNLRALTGFFQISRGIPAG